MISARPATPQFTPHPIQLLAANIKLNVINKLRLNSHLAPVASVAPAQITLTPANPTAGPNNYITMHGQSCASPGSCYISLDSNFKDFLNFQVDAVVGKTYLADIFTDLIGTNDWAYYIGDYTTSVPTTLQQGHLLVPFIPTRTPFWAGVIPIHGSGFIMKVEVTKVD